MQKKTASIDEQLNSLFDFQKFIQNKELDSEIQDTIESVCTDLSEDDLSLISAAGINSPKTPVKPE